MEFADEREELIYRLGVDHRLAHQTLFQHRHPDLTPPFHYEIIDDLHGPSRRVIEMAFRGAAKSTLAEEAIALDMCYERYKNYIIIGESETRAVERLNAVKHELDFNDGINAIFGSVHGSVWNENKIILANGAVVQAFGRGQSLRGVKHNDVRPDGCLIDDLEDEDSVATPESRDKTQQWLMRTLLPALAPGAKVRMLANMLDPDCLAVRLKKSGVWTVRVYPWEYLDEDGERQATWPSRFPLAYIDRTKDEYVKSGMLNEYMQEYMVQAIDPSTRVFTTDMLKVQPQVRTWQATYAMYDPARTVKTKTSAHTGKVVFSWIGNKLVFWEGDGQFWLPDAIIDDMFAVQDQYQPVHIGVEKEGLEEFIMQPLRVEQTKRNTILPVKVMPAPVGKIPFIRSMQPFFKSGMVEFAKDMPEFRQQLLDFPTGRIDIPNAAAYALRMRPGLPLYETFGFKNVVDDLLPLRGTQTYLALGATRQYTSGVLVQVVGGTMRVLADWLREGDPGTVLKGIVTDASLFIGAAPICYSAPTHWQNYDMIGLLPAARAAQVRLATGGAIEAGREELRRRIDAMTAQTSQLLVSTRARWTLNALAGGYARQVVKGKEVTGMADEGVYKVLMEGFEAFAAATAGALVRDGADRPNYDMDAQGRRFLSARATHHGQARGTTQQKDE